MMARGGWSRIYAPLPGSAAWPTPTSPDVSCRGAPTASDLEAPLLAKENDHPSVRSVAPGEIAISALGRRAHCDLEWSGASYSVVRRDAGTKTILAYLLGLGCERSIAIMRGLCVALCLGLLGLAGCTSLGPATIRSDRNDFAEAIADAAKREVLLNIVKLRYADTPGLVSVSQLVAGYSLNGSANLGTIFFDNVLAFSDDINVGVSGSFSENPTVTYTPVVGEDFARIMLTPIPPSELFAMVAAGAPPDILLGLGVESINGLRNWSADVHGASAADPGFVEVLRLIDSLRRHGLLGFGFQTTNDAQTAELLINDRSRTLRDNNVRRLVGLLGLDPAARSFPLVFGFGDGTRDQIKVYTRSLFEILSSLAARISVPDGDVAAGHTYDTRSAPVGAIPTIAVKHRALPPWSDFAAVEYHGTWYWIDDADYASKRVFSGLMLILNAVEKTGQPQLPVITIPTG
jgi:hypothetical protein